MANRVCAVGTSSLGDEAAASAALELASSVTTGHTSAFTVE